MTGNKPDLLPCPFCGGEAKISRSGRYSLFCAYCVDCDTNGGHYFTEEDAIAAWNRRDGERHAIEPEERTCRMVEVKTGEVADYRDTDEILFHCKSCHAERGIFSYDVDGNVYSTRPEYCPNCGAKVVTDDD